MIDTYDTSHPSLRKTSRTNRLRVHFNLSASAWDTSLQNDRKHLSAILTALRRMNKGFGNSHRVDLSNLRQS